MHSDIFDKDYLQIVHVFWKKISLKQDYVVNVSSSHYVCRHYWHNNIKFAFTYFYLSSITKHFLHYQRKTCMIKKTVDIPYNFQAIYNENNFCSFGQQCSKSGRFFSLFYCPIQECGSLYDENKHILSQVC
jgi:hypothetical protein